MTFDANASEIKLTKSGVTIFDATNLPGATIPSAEVTGSGFVLTFPDMRKDNAYYHSGASAGDGLHRNEYMAAYITMLPQNWGPTADDPGGVYTDDLPDIVLGPAPAGADFLDIRLKITRTADPTPLLGDTLPPVLPQGKTMPLLGQSLLLEEGPNFKRGIALLIKDGNIVLRRFQSASGVLEGLNYSPTNSPATNAAYTYKTAPGNLCYIIAADYHQTTSSTDIWQRGSANQLANYPMTDTTNYGSTYSLDFTIAPGYFNVDPTINAPTAKAMFHTWDIYDTAPAASPGTTWTYSVPIGLPAASRRVYVMIGSGNSITSTSFDVSSVTIGGVAATKEAGVATNNSGATAYQSSSIWSAAVPTGTSASVVITYTSNATGFNFVVAFVSYNLASGTHDDAETRSSAGAMSLATAADGFALSFGRNITSMSGDTLGAYSYQSFWRVGLTPTTGATFSTPIAGIGGSFPVPPTLVAAAFH